MIGFNIYFYIKKDKTDSIAKGTRGLSSLGKTANLDLNSYDSIEVHAGNMEK